MSRQAATHGLRLLIDKERAEAAEWRHHVDAPTSATRSALFDRYRHFAQKVALEEWRRFADLGLEHVDIEQIAYEALLRALDRFDPSHGAPFTAFARMRLRGAIRNALPKATEANAIYGARKRMERDRLRSLKHATSNNSEDSLEILRELAAEIALGFILESKADTALDGVPSNDPSAYDALVWNQLVGELDMRIAALPERERKVLDYHYRQHMQFQQIALLLGVSKGRISQLHAQALQRLRKHLSKYR